MVGNHQPNSIKTGMTGKKPRVARVIWEGTAEVTTYDLARVPARWVATDRDERMAIVRLAGDNFEHDVWWDARCVPCREWEDTDGNLIRDTQPSLAAEIDAFFETATQRHLNARRELNARLAAGKYALA